METCLCGVAEERIGSALDELWRVCRNGLIFGSVTSDLTPAVLDRYDLLRGVQRLATWWEWSEDLFNAGFGLAIQDTPMLNRLWEKTMAARCGSGPWYRNPEALRYCFFRKIPEDADVTPIRASGHQ